MYFPPTSGFTGFSINCSSVIMTVEHDDRRPHDEASSIALTGTSASQDVAVDLLSLLRLNGELAVDPSELTDWMLLAALSCSVSSSRFVLLSSPCAAEPFWVDIRRDSSSRSLWPPLGKENDIKTTGL